MLHAFGPCDLELRARGGGMSLRGSFPYNRKAVLHDGGKSGRPRKEYFKSRAFAYGVEDETIEIHLLVGHDFGKPLASKLNGSLVLDDTDDALLFTAQLSNDILETSHGRDAVRMLDAGLVGGISPGFRIPPPRTVPDAERVFNEDPSEGRALIREISHAVLYELSIVTRPAYDQTQISARNWEPGAPGTDTTPRSELKFTAHNRWR